MILGRHPCQVEIEPEFSNDRLKSASTPRNSEPTYYNATAVVCDVTDSFPGTSLAAVAACCSSVFHVKWDTLYISVFDGTLQEMVGREALFSQH
jgi:hypothetical protein